MLPEAPCTCLALPVAASHRQSFHYWTLCLDPLRQYNSKHGEERAANLFVTENVWYSSASMGRNVLLGRLAFEDAPEGAEAVATTCPLWQMRLS